MSKVYFIMTPYVISIYLIELCTLLGLAVDDAGLRAARARLGDVAGLGDVSRRPEHPQ